MYDLSGEASDPFNPSAPPEKFASGASTTSQLRHDGDIVIDESTSSESAGRTTTKARWASARVTLVSLTVETPAGSFACTFKPELVIIHIPIKAEKFPTQNISGDGNACGGKVDITVEGKEDVKDAAGKTWSTWRVKVHTQTDSGQLKTTNDETRWFSPDLGVQIRQQSNQSGKLLGSELQSKSTHASTLAPVDDDSALELQPDSRICTRDRLTYRVRSVWRW